jgi:hypothetical protein
MKPGLLSMKPALLSMKPALWVTSSEHFKVQSHTCNTSATLYVTRQL